MNWKTTIPLVLILSCVFLVNLSQHIASGLPIHVDAWIEVSLADAITKQRSIPSTEPFSHTKLNDPIGNPVFQAAFSELTGLNLLHGATLLPALLNTILALLLYAVSMQLFNNKHTALAVAGFTPLILSQITMLGPFYLVNLCFGMVLVLLYFWFILRQEFGLAMLTFIAIGVTHRSTMVFALIATVLYFLFNKKLWNKLLYLGMMVVLSIIVFGAISGYGLLLSILREFMMFGKSWPYFQYINMLGSLFLALLALGLYLIILNEPKARRFLVPLLGFMALDMFLYWSWRGFFLVYRRLISFIFLLTPFFVGYAVAAVAARFKRYSYLVLVLLLIVLMPLAIKQNIRAITPLQVYITNEEHELFTNFGKANPGVAVLTDHLEAYALPYYNLTPISLSPGHGVNSSFYNEVGLCYMAGDLDCIAGFLNRTGFSYLYVGRNISRAYLKPTYTAAGKTIYWFNKSIYQKIYNTE